MNERVKELLIQSQLLEAIGTNAYEEDGWEPIVSEFAELIVNQCLNFVDVGRDKHETKALIKACFLD